MQADEFEKDIQDKMKGLHIVPDGNVWNHVSIKIEKEKKKRRILLFWFFACFLLIAGTGIFWFLQKDNKDLSNEANNNFVQRKKDRKTIDVPKSLSTIKKSSNAGRKKDFARYKIDEIRKPATKIAHQTKATFSKVEDAEPAMQIAKAENGFYKAKKTIEKPIEKSIPPDKFYHPNAAAANVVVTEITNDINKSQDAKKTSFVNDLPEKNTAATNVNKKWKFGFTVYSGISNNVNGLPIIKKNYAQNYNSYLSNAAPGTVSNGNVSNNFKSGFSFGLGVFVKKEIFTKIGLSLGVDYHLYQAKFAVGQKVSLPRTFFDSVQQSLRPVTNYYTAGNLADYSNKYYLIQFPVNLGFSINKNKERPLALSVGISPGYLFGSNALYANTTANVYYEDKQKLHRFQLSGQAGLSFPIIHSARFLLNAGPEIQYGCMKVANTTSAISQHLFFTGIKANIILK